MFLYYVDVFGANFTCSNAPDMDNVVVVDGVQIPLGVCKETGYTNPAGGFTLAYNEYIVYNVAQVKIKCIVKAKFNYKDR